jgi:hypothetical protein
MRIRLACLQCDPTHGVNPWFVETIREDGLYTGKCPLGHDLLLATQTLQHEMLFEIALNAIADGYYREAVSSFAASVERFYEFAVRVICSSHEIEQSAFEEAWRKIVSQSERQLGAYIFLHLLEFGAPPPILNNRMTELRNGVIHRGSLPDRTGALSFGSAVYDVIQQGVRRLRETDLEHVNKVLGEHLNKIFERMGDRYPRAVLVTPTALNIIEDISAGYRTFDQIVRDHASSASAAR